MIGFFVVTAMVTFLGFVSAGCSVSVEEGKEKLAVAESPQQANSSNQPLIPLPSYYSTEKGRYLAEHYKKNLQGLLTNIVKNPETGKLQFADANLSIKSVGFFSHSAGQATDERYLEVILWAPEVFDDKTDVSSKLRRLFSQYGTALLNIISSDDEIYREKFVAGYGLNVSWRNLSEAGVSVERAVIYMSKDQARKFLDEKISQEEVLAGAAIFSVQEAENPRLVHYSRAEPKPKTEAQAKSIQVTRWEPSELKESDIDIPDKAAESSYVAPKKSKVTLARNKSTDMPAETAKPKVHPLHGHVVQLLLPASVEAERLAALFQKEGYSTSMNTASGEELAPLRIGNFASFSDAQKFLSRLQDKNVKGLVLFVP